MALLQPRAGVGAAEGPGVGLRRGAAHVRAGRGAGAAPAHQRQERHLLPGRHRRQAAREVSHLIYTIADRLSVLHNFYQKINSQETFINFHQLQKSCALQR